MKILLGQANSGGRKPWFAAEHINDVDARSMRSLYRELRQAGIRDCTVRAIICTAFQCGVRADMRRRP